MKIEMTNFENLFIFDVANNHQGSVEHGLKIIRGVSEMVNKHKVRGAIKFQFRQLDSFIHASHQENSEAAHISRFFSTRLDRKDYQVLLDKIRSHNMLSMCTPFDEESVDVIVDMGFDFLKIASCSGRDWPLLEKIADTSLPVVFSTGGLAISQIDDLVSFFNHRGVDAALMHCVGIYPTPDEQCNLNQIDSLLQRYPGVTIGWSTHEDPNDTVPIQIATAKGARMFERHVGFETDEIKLNGYSSTPEQLDKWLAAFTKAKSLCGPVARPAVPEVERASMDSLRRGVYAKKLIRKGSIIDRDKVYFAMPYQDGQLTSGEWLNEIVADKDVNADQPLFMDGVQYPRNPNVLILKHAVHEVKALLNKAKVVLNSEFTVEYSHHYGISNFMETGAVLISCINRDYSKKILVQLPNQKHPAHFHKQKEETFQVLSGELNIIVDGHHSILHPGETKTVLPGVWHEFWTETGTVFEEISTTDLSNDSFYRDKKINQMQRHERKTVVDHWGRFQMGFALSQPQAISE